MSADLEKRTPGDCSGHVLGCAFIGGTLVLWVGSSIVLQAIFSEGTGFRQPVFVTLFNSAVGVSLLLPRLAVPGSSCDLCWGYCAGCGWCSRRAEDSRSASAALRAVAPLSATVGLLQLFSQWVFNMSLLHTSVATNTVMSSTSSVFTFVFSLVICGDPFRWPSLCAAAASFLGCTLVAMENPRNLEAGAVTNSNLGNEMALASAAMFALVSVLLRRLAPDGLDLGSFMGMNGLLALGLSPALLYAAHTGGVERFQQPSIATLAFLTANALIGCTLANYLYTSALLLLSPLVANVCLSLSIPLSALADELLLQQHGFSAGWALGAALVVAGVACAAFDLRSDSREGSLGANRRERAESAELESLLEDTDASGDEEGCAETFGRGMSRTGVSRAINKEISLAAFGITGRRRVG